MLPLISSPWATILNPCLSSSRTPSSSYSCTNDGSAFVVMTIGSESIMVSHESASKMCNWNWISFIVSIPARFRSVDENVISSLAFFPGATLHENIVSTITPLIAEFRAWTVTRFEELFSMRTSKVAPKMEPVGSNDVAVTLKSFWSNMTFSSIDTFLPVFEALAPAGSDWVPEPVGVPSSPVSEDPPHAAKLIEINTTSRTERNFFMIITSFYVPTPYVLVQNVSKFALMFASRFGLIVFNDQ